MKLSGLVGAPALLCCLTVVQAEPVQWKSAWRGSPPAMSPGGSGSVQCEMINSLGRYSALAGATPTVHEHEAVHRMASGQNGGAPNQPPGDVGVPHGATQDHPVMQKLAAERDAQGRLVVRIDGAQLSATMSTHHRQPHGWQPEQFRFQVFADLPAVATKQRHVLIARSASVDVKLNELRSGALVVTPADTAAAGTNASLSLVVRATAPGHEDESPQIICPLKLAP